MRTDLLRRIGKLAVVVIAALAVGATIGLAAYSISEAGGRAQYAATGAAGAAVATLAILLFRRSLTLTSLTLALPSVTELTFTVNPDSRRLAWRLFHHAARRSIVQPLDDGAGYLREVLSSIYAWTQFMGDVLDQAGPSNSAKPGARSVEHLAYMILNEVLRPFLSKWHTELGNFEKNNPDSLESDWPLQEEFRHELRELQRTAHPYLVGLAELAGITEPERFIGDVPEVVP